MTMQQALNRHSTASKSNPPEKIGLVAGWGDFPVEVAKSLLAQGHEVHCCAISGHAAPVLESLCTSYRVFGMGRMGGQVRFCDPSVLSVRRWQVKFLKHCCFNDGGIC